MCMLIVLFRVVAFFTNLLMENFTLFDSSCLFCCSEVPSPSGNIISNVVCKHDIAAPVAIQPHMGFLCSLLFLLVDDNVWIGFDLDDCVDALELAGTASKAGDGLSNTELPQDIH